MALGDDDEDMATELDGDDVAGDELFNRCINDTLEAQEVPTFVWSDTMDKLLAK